MNYFCEFTSHSGQLYYLLKLFETPRCQFCTKMPEMSDLCYLENTRLDGKSGLSDIHKILASTCLSETVLPPSSIAMAKK